MGWIWMAPHSGAPQVELSPETVTLVRSQLLAIAHGSILKPIQAREFRKKNIHRIVYRYCKLASTWTEMEDLIHPQGYLSQPCADGIPCRQRQPRHTHARTHALPRSSSTGQKTRFSVLWLLPQTNAGRELRCSLLSSELCVSNTQESAAASGTHWIFS